MAEDVVKKSYLSRLGEFVFSIDGTSYDAFDHNSSYRWASIAIVGGKPKLHFMGPNSDKVLIRGTLFPTFRGGLGQIEKMRAQAGKGEPLRFVTTTSKVGVNLGKWVISSIKEQKSYFLPNGVPRKIRFTLELIEYGN